MTFSKGQTFAAGQLAAAVADLYAPAALTAAYIRSIHLTNITGGAVVYTIAKRIAGVDYIIESASLAAGASARIEHVIVGDGDILRGFAAAATSIDFVVEGVLES